MTNYEKYRDRFENDIKRFLESVIAVVDGEPVPCDSVKGCKGCKFELEINCEGRTREWLDEEWDKEDRE